MPEGDTVWLAARNLRAALAGQSLLRSDFRVPHLATADLTGHTLLDVRSAGKHLLFRIGPDVTLHSHLRMDGSWHLYRSGARWTGGPGHEIRAVLETADWTAVGYRLPVLDLLATADEARVIGHLGPDLLAEEFDEDAAVRRLRADPGRAIGEALLDQRVIAGIGNLYKAETLFLVGVSPWRATADVADPTKLVRLARRLMLANAARSGQVTTGDTRPGHTTWVYGRGGRSCRRCGTRIRQADQGAPPRARVTCWCPNCQP